MVRTAGAVKRMKFRLRTDASSQQRFLRSHNSLFSPSFVAMSGLRFRGSRLVFTERRAVAHQGVVRLVPGIAGREQRSLKEKTDD